MPDSAPTPVPEFADINPGFNRTFRSDRLSLGLVMPIEAHGNNPVPELARHLERAQLAESLGFSAVWLRDVPFNVPSFGDAGQTFDPFVYLGYLAGQTDNIALGVASVILPLRHPAHVAKAAASADVLSGGRLILGVASGDRPEEYPALNMDFTTRAERFRTSLAYIRAMGTHRPEFENPQGNPYGGMDMLPKPFGDRIPLLVTGSSRQSPDWIADHADGWITYPRGIPQQQAVTSDWHARVEATGQSPKPVMQSLYIDLMPDPGYPPEPIHLGFRSGVDYLRGYLTALRQIGVHHVALNLRFNQHDVEDTLRRLAETVLPELEAA